MVVLIPISFVITILCVIAYTKNDECALSYSVCIYSFVLYLTVELLSIGENITKLSLSIVWGAVIIVGGIYIFYWLKRNSISSFVGMVSCNYKYLIPFVLFAACVLILSFNTVPYNYDSMMYHLPRIAIWARNGSVEHFATSFPNQIAAPVFSEYIGLNIYVLSGYSDRYLTLLQATSYIICAFLVGGIAKKIGCSLKWQYIASFLFISLPIAFAESLNTQNDLITAALLLSFVDMLLRYFEGDGKLLSINRESTIHTILTALCMGIAFLTKYYVAFAISIFFLWLLFECIKNKVKVANLLYHAFLGAMGFVSIMLPESVRTYNTFGMLFGTSFSTRQFVATVDPRYLFVCFLKNFMFNFANQYIYRTNEFLEWLVSNAARILSVDLLDRRISGIDQYTINYPFDYYHDNAANNMICIMICVSFVLCLKKYIIMKAERKNKDSTIESVVGRRTLYKGYFIASYLSFVFFLSFLRYTAHRTRYEIAFFALLCPAIALTFQKFLSEKKKIIIVTTIFLLGSCDLINSFIYHSRFADYKRPEAYFIANDNILTTYTQLEELVRWHGYRTVGLMGRAYYEYPYWGLLSDDVDIIEYVNVDNNTSIHEDMNYKPECIIYIAESDPTGKTIECHGDVYQVINVIVYGDLFFSFADNISK